MNLTTKPLPFLWSVIKPYKYSYLVMMIAPIASGVYPIIYNYAVKLLLDLFTRNARISFAQSYKPIMVFIAAQATLDGAWRAHNFAQLKTMPYVFQDMMHKISNHCFNLPYSYFQENLSGSIVGKIGGIGDNYYRLHQSVEGKLSISLSNTLFSGITLVYINIKIFAFVAIFIAVYLSLALSFFLLNLLRWSRLGKMLGITYLVLLLIVYQIFLLFFHLPQNSEN